MFIRIWQYDIAAERAAEFERAYGADGPWALLFARSPGYLGTELYQGVGTAGRYLTIDRFADRAVWQRFLADHRVDYDDLDRQLASLTVLERALAEIEIG